MQLHLLTLLTTLLCLFGVEAGKKHEAFKYGIWITGYGNDNCEDPPRLKRENALHGHCTTFGKYRGPLTSMRASIMNKWDLADRCRIWFYSDKNCTGKSWYAGEIGRTKALCRNIDTDSGFAAWSVIAMCKYQYPTANIP